jgi:hypothetical protein
LKLRERLKGRHLTEAQTVSLTTFLQQGPKGTVQFFFIANEEAINLCNQLSKILIEADWVIKPVTDYMFAGGVPGIRLLVPEANANDPATLRLSDGLRDLGLDAFLTIVDPRRL